MITLFLALFWFLREVKHSLFWIYLWQLKEYHIGRFLAHFSTEKGRKLLFNKLTFLKTFLFLLFLFLPLSFSFYQYSIPWQPLSCGVLLALYFLETLKFFLDIYSQKSRRPVLTKKTAFLIIIAWGLEAFYLFTFYENRPLFPLFLLIFDLLTPLVVSGTVLIFQPLAVLLRNRELRKAKAKRKRLQDLVVIGITGSYGKTSTKEFLATILSEKFKVLKTKKNQNSEVGISRCILNDLKQEHEIFVVEMGAYNRGGIRLLSEIAKPKIGILTGINQQHLATFGSQENIIKAKYELIKSLPPNGLAVFNGNNEHCRSLYQKTKISKKISYVLFSGKEERELPEKKDVWAKDIRKEKDKLVFEVFSQNGKSALFELNLAGAYNIENILLAVCVAQHLGMNLQEISRACQRIKRGQVSVEVLRGINKTTVVKSTYSSNPKGVISHLDYLGHQEGRKIMIMPCLIELGKASGEIHQTIGEKAGRVCDMIIVLSKECFKALKEGFDREKKGSVLLIQNPKEAVKKVKRFIRPGDTILLEGRMSKEIIDSLVLNQEE